MNPLSIHVTPLKIPFNISFDHASNSRSETATVLVQVVRGNRYGLGEGCPRPYVTDETVDSAMDWIKKIKSLVEVKCTSLNDLYLFLRDYKEIIDKNPSAWCAIETALLDLFGKEQNRNIEELLGIKNIQGDYQYTAVVGDGNEETINRYFDLYLQFGFWDYKIKICGDLDRDKKKIDLFKQKVLRVFPEKARLRIDANNLWCDYHNAFTYLKKLDYPFLGIEEPLLQRESKKLSQLSKDLSTPIILDESLCYLEDLNLFSLLEGEFIANIRVSKVGGLLRGLKMIRKIKTLNWKIIIGSLVGETSILTRTALSLAKASGENLLAQEGAFGTILLSNEIVKPVLMFGKGGVLKFQHQQNGSNLLSGLGITKGNNFEKLIITKF
jgi:L-alanine-DL-glutamate epimerase-like enolase superfamily enzyme